MRQYRNILNCMIWQEIDLDGYWLATVIYVPLEKDMPMVAEALNRLGCPDMDIEENWRNMTVEWNRGYTWSNPARRRSITLIGRATSWEQFFNTVQHETSHIVDEVVALICEGAVLIRASGIHTGRDRKADGTGDKEDCLPVLWGDF